MARPKRQLTIEQLEQASDAADYFKRMFVTESKYLKTSIAKKKGESETTALLEAREALEALPPLLRSRYDSRSRKLIPRPLEDVVASLDAFRAWVAERVTEVGWTRCLANLRQARHTNPDRGKLKSIKLPFGTHHDLKRWASKRSFTLNGALVELLKIADGHPSKR